MEKDWDFLDYLAIETRQATGLNKMTNSYYLAQYRVDSASGLTKDSSEPEHINITEAEFTALLRQYWPDTKSPEEFPEKNWLYVDIRKSETEKLFGELSLLGNSMIAERHLELDAWVLLCIIFQRFVKRPVYLWNDSNLEDLLEITDSMTEHDILLWMDSR